MMFSYLDEELSMRLSAFKRITISGLATVLGIGLGLLTTQTTSRAQQQKEKEKGPLPRPFLSFCRIIRSSPPSV
jgi:hypothetical protein